MSGARHFPPSETTRKRACYTKAGGRSYPLPANMGHIVAVTYKGREYPIELMLFEVPTTRTYLRVYSMDGPPATREEAFAMLKAAHGTFSYRAMWLRWGDEVLIWPPTPNAGEVLVIEHEVEAVAKGNKKNHS